MRGYIVRGDQEIVDVSVGDLSYSGCAVHTDTLLEPGEVVLLSVLGRGGGRAIVRWYKDRVAGLEFVPVDPPYEQVPRSTDRKPVKAEVLLRRTSHSGYRVRAFDLSPLGCRCEFIERPRIGERLWVKFDGLEALESEVRWIREADAGVIFVRPIHPAVFDMVLQRST
jgi:hypothetical protein